MNDMENRMIRISIPSGVSDKLKGKTIEKTSFYTNMNDYDENHLVITFTDGTYIAICIDNEDDYYLSDYLQGLSYYNINQIGYVVGDDYRYRQHFKQLIDIGVLEPLNEDIVKHKLLENKRLVEINEYSQYQSLKKKYEHYNPNENADACQQITI